MSEKRKLDEMESGEEELSLQDVIAEDHELEATANAVLGGSDETECTFEQGYVDRQAVFACNTCSNTRAGVCLACSLECHKGHDLFELYTKRNFRCDCGNSRFNKKCNFIKKPPTNSENVYNHNFEGLYCSCDRPYPDPDDDVADEMIQCVVCEDWYHGRHLGDTKLPPHMEFSEMICFDCSKNNEFLHKYSFLFVAPSKVEKVEQEQDVEIEKTCENDDNKTSEKNDAKLPENVEKNSDQSEPTTSQSPKNIQKDHTENLPKESGDIKPETQETKTICKVEKLKPVSITGATFWPNGWRNILCKCEQCLMKYEDNKMVFLTNEEDTVKSYEEKGRRYSHVDDKVMLEGMPHTQQVEMIHGFNEMKEGLSKYLRKFADEGKVVTKNDITNFFSSLQNKKRKVELSYNCR